MRKRKLILIVLYEHEWRVTLRRVYEKAGHEVLSTTSAAEAYQILGKSVPPDLIVTGGASRSFSISDFLRVLKSSESWNEIRVAILKGSKNVPAGVNYQIDLAHPKTALDALGP